MTITLADGLHPASFINCTMLTEINISKNTTSIGAETFKKTGITSFTIHNVTKIGNNAFENCLYLTALYIENTQSVITAGNDILIGTKPILKIFVANELLEAYRTAPNWITYLSSFVSKDVLKDQYIFSETTDKVTIVQYFGKEPIITIPAQINGKRVEIGEYAFAYNNDIKQIILPDTLNDIPGGAFRSCRNLEFVYIPAAVKTIGAYAFFDCQNLAYVEFEDGAALDTIGDFCFGQNFKLTQIKFTALSVGSIGESVFKNCSALTDADFSNVAIQTVGKLLFQNCTALTTVKLPKVQSIGIGAFTGCMSIRNITVPFVGAASYLKYYFNISSATSFNSIPESLTTVNVSEGVKAIQSNAFYDCSNIVLITLPASVTSIGSSAFYNCSLLQEVTILNTQLVTLNNQNAFSGCHTNLKFKVPAALAEAYKTAPNWSVFSEKIVGI